MNVDLIISNASQLVTCASPSGAKRSAAMSDVGVIVNGAVAIAEGKIVAVGTTDDIRANYQAAETIDASGQVICPGFVDPHTHLVHGGDRVQEFEMRLRGATYMEILERGGGILSTMYHTRQASLEQLVDESRRRLDAMLAQGTTTVEVKSGYGLGVDSEIKMLEVMAELEAEHPIDLVPTFLGAHAYPPEYQHDREGYIDLIEQTMLPMIAQWYQSSPFKVMGKPLFCDVFCDAGVFDVTQSERILQAGLALGMPAKIHADEFQNLGGVSLAVRLGAISADHLDVTPLSEMQALADAETIGVILPAVNFNFGSSRFAEARTMIDAGAAIALATDYNPGSAPCLSMPLVMAIACRYQHLLPAEALNAATINAAYAIGLGDRCGSLETGKQADLLILNASDYRYLAYQFGVNLIAKVVKGGKPL